MAVIFLSGAPLGSELASIHAPNSAIAMFVGFFVLPLSFAWGLMAWQGLTFVLLLIRFIWRMITWSKERWEAERKANNSEEALNRELRSKAWIVIVVYLAVCGAGGVLVGVVGGLSGLPMALLQFLLLGLLYGGAVYGLAQADMIPLMEEF